jgi:hypothetical protein
MRTKILAPVVCALLGLVSPVRATPITVQAGYAESGSASSGLIITGLGLNPMATGPEAANVVDYHLGYTNPVSHWDSAVIKITNNTLAPITVTDVLVTTANPAHGSFSFAGGLGSGFGLASSQSLIVTSSALNNNLTGPGTVNPGNVSPSTAQAGELFDLSDFLQESGAYGSPVPIVTVFTSIGNFTFTDPSLFLAGHSVRFTYRSPDDNESEGYGTLTPTPEPASLVSLGLGLALCGGYAWRRRRYGKA